MAEDIRGLTTSEIIRLDVGSPTTLFEFTKSSDSLLIDNYDTTNPVFFAFGSIAITPGSTTGLIPAGAVRGFDYRTTTMSFIGSGTGSPTSEVQVLSMGLGLDE